MALAALALMLVFAPSALAELGGHDQGLPPGDAEDPAVRAQDRAEAAAAHAAGKVQDIVAGGEDEAQEQSQEGAATAEEQEQQAERGLQDGMALADEATAPLWTQVDRIVEQSPGQLVAGVVDPLERKTEELQGEVGRVVLGEEEDEPAPEEETAPQAAAVVPASELTAPLLLAAGAATAGAVVLFWLAGSSTGVGGAGAGYASASLRRVLPAASPLFTRFSKDTVLGHPKREELYAAVIETPGVTLQELCRRANLSRTAVAHHLRLMEQQHLVVSKRHGRSRHFYENGGRYARDQKDAYAVLQNDRSRHVAEFIQNHPGAIQKHICEALGIQASVAHWHVKRLQDANLVEPIRQGRTVSYFPAAPLPEAAA